MACDQTKGEATLRNNIFILALRSVIHQVGCTASQSVTRLTLAGSHPYSNSRGLHWCVGLCDFPPFCPFLSPRCIADCRLSCSGNRAVKAQPFWAIWLRWSYDSVPLDRDSLDASGRRCLASCLSWGTLQCQIGKATFLRSVRQQLSCSLCRGDNSMYFESTCSTAWADGCQLTPNQLRVPPIDESGEV